jgi:hypothetical protein
VSLVNQLIQEIHELRIELNVHKIAIERKAVEIDSIGDRMSNLDTDADQYIKARDKRRRLREEIIEINQMCLDLEARIEHKKSLIEYGDLREQQSA